MNTRSRTAAAKQIATKSGSSFVLVGALCTLGACAQIADIDPPKHKPPPTGSGASGGDGGGGAGGSAGEGGTSGGGMGGNGCMPKETLCDGVDDDCNGQIDDFPVLMCGVGACQVTVQACVNGTLSECVPKSPTSELCNNVDDDCNGIVDNNIPESGMDCMTGLSGLCAPGKTECVAGMIVCKPNVMPSTEVCNNIDDDCNGVTDNDNPGSGMMCSTGLLGECASGITTCSGGAVICVAPTPMLDICDGLDNNCDGAVDNQGVGVGVSCMTGIPGECSTGFTNCEMGMLKCAQSKLPATEICDNKDNDCNGMTDEGNPNGGATCTLMGLKGACAVGTMMCQTGVLTCTQTVLPMNETCDGIDNDCDGDVDEGPDVNCGTCQTPVLASGDCVSLPTPAVVTLMETCKQEFPAPANASIPVTITNPGTQYYVSPTGSDTNDGTTPAKAWNTLCKALAMVRPGNTIQVAQGSYLSSSAVVAKGITVKGGYNTAFTQWNPEAFPSIFYGQLTLDHASAVWGGFRMISNPISAAQSQHTLKAGTFVRNYVEAVFAQAVTMQSTGIDTTACPTASITMTGNDVYVGAANATSLRAIGFGNQRGALVLDSNRICAQGNLNNGQTFAIHGVGPNAADMASVLLKNNLLETANSGGSVVFMEGAAGGVDFPTTMTNNTLLAWENGVGGTGAASGTMKWRLTNNILFSLNNNAVGVSLVSGPGVSFDSAENNLVFGFSTNALTDPGLGVNTYNDTTNVATAASVFLNAPTGDFRIVVGGQGDETGKNVHNVGSYGFVTTDLNQSPRPPDGLWDRGALKN